MDRLISHGFKLEEYVPDYGLEFPICSDHSVPIERILFASDMLIESRLMGVPALNGRFRQSVSPFVSQADEGSLTFPSFMTSCGMELDLRLNAQGKPVQFVSLALNHLIGNQAADNLDRIILQYPLDRRTVFFEQAMDYMP